MTHVYTGPTTAWGLLKGTLGSKQGGRAGGVNFKRRSDGKLFTVGKKQVEKNDARHSS